MSAHCLFYGHDAPADGVIGDASAVYATNCSVAAPADASAGVAVANYKQISKIKLLDTHPTKPLVVTADVVRACTLASLFWITMRILYAVVPCPAALCSLVWSVCGTMSLGFDCCAFRLRTGRSSSMQRR